MNPPPVVGASQLTVPVLANPLDVASTVATIDFVDRVKRQRLNDPGSVTDQQFIDAVNYSNHAVASLSNAGMPPWAVAMQQTLQTAIQQTQAAIQQTQAAMQQTSQNMNARFTQLDAQIGVVQRTIDDLRVTVMDEAARSANSSANRLERSEERRVGKECRSRWSPYH